MKARFGTRGRQRSLEAGIVGVAVTSPQQCKQAYLGCLLFALGVDSSSALLGTLAFDLLQLFGHAVGLALGLVLLRARLAQSAYRLFGQRFRLMIVPLERERLLLRAEQT